MTYCDIVSLFCLLLGLALSVNRMASQEYTKLLTISLPRS